MPTVRAGTKRQHSLSERTKVLGSEDEEKVMRRREDEGADERGLPGLSSEDAARGLRSLAARSAHEEDLSGLRDEVDGGDRPADPEDGAHLPWAQGGAVSASLAALRG